MDGNKEQREAKFRFYHSCRLMGLFCHLQSTIGKCRNNQTKRFTPPVADASRLLLCACCRIEQISAGIHIGRRSLQNKVGLHTFYSTRRKLCCLRERHQKFLKVAVSTRVLEKILLLQGRPLSRAVKAQTIK